MAGAAIVGLISQRRKLAAAGPCPRKTVLVGMTSAIFGHDVANLLG